MFDFTFDKESVLRELGLDQSDDAFKTQIIDSIYAQLALRVRGRILPELSQEELDAFNKITDDNEAKAWLEARFPDHETIYQEELNQLIEEMNQHADSVDTALNNLPQ